MNVLAPLVNPARPQFQLVGVADPARIELLSKTFESRGSDVLVVRGHDGLDKLTVSGPTDLTLVCGGHTSSFTLTPEDVGLGRSDLETLRGSTPAANAHRLTAVLEGIDQGPIADAVMLNAAAACVLLDGGEHNTFVDRLREQVALCGEILASGEPGRKLRAWVEAAGRHSHT